MEIGEVGLGPRLIPALLFDKENKIKIDKNALFQYRLL